MNTTDSTTPSGSSSPGGSSSSGSSGAAAAAGSDTREGVTQKLSKVRDAVAGPKGTSRSPRPTGSGAAGSASSANPAGAKGAAGGAAKRNPRRVRLTLARLDPWSVMKLSFLIAIAVGVATVIATAVLWMMVDAIGLWDQINEIGSTISEDGKPLKFLEYFQFGKMLSYATLFSIVNVVIMTALGTLCAFLYNIVAALLGGLKVTFTDS